MMDLLKSLLDRAPGKAEELSAEEYYVAGKSPDGRKIPHSVSKKQVQKALDGETFRWSCTACGKCCRGPGVVYFTEEDLKNIRSRLGLSDAQWEQLYTRLIQKKKNGLFLHQTAKSCALLGRDGRCTVYEVRPLQCRTFPFWTSNFESRESYEWLKDFCPGMKTGREEFSLQRIVIETNRTEDLFARLQTGTSKTLYL
jgi:Fe-S-cluster containining protein